ncbi:MAG: glycosyltransferase, partial [Geminicoccaceae bacterium]|nr:glycosyltransferase [Geminicoccaceae bacterium]
RLGVDVRVATTNANGKTKLDVDTSRPVAFEPNYRVRYYEDTIINRFSLAFTLGLPRDVRDADVVHLQDVFSLHAAWALFLCWWRRIPVLISPRGVFSEWALAQRRLLKRAWLRGLVFPWCRDRRRVAFHATSEEEAVDIERLFSRHRVFVVPNGIDCAEFGRCEVPAREAYLRRFWPACPVPASEATVAVGLGRIHLKKAFEVAIEALSLLRSSHRGLILMIAGADDGDLERLEKIVSRLGLRDRVYFAGPLTGTEKIAFLKGADVFLFPSHSENFGLACLEALAAGLPVVASRNTPWRAIEEAGAGKWVENAPEAFARALGELLARPREPMRAAALEVARRFDLREIARQFVRIYGDILDAGEVVRSRGDQEPRARSIRRSRQHRDEADRTERADHTISR